MARREAQNVGVREEIGRFRAQVGGHRLPLGMGCATIGQGGDAETLRRFHRTLEFAYENGLRYYDTSVLYGGSEFRVGRFLRGVARETVFVATKSLLPSALSPEEAAVHIRQSLHNSLERLGLTQIDLFQIHDVDRLDAVLAPGGPLETLIEAKQSGLIRCIGLATRYHHLLRTAVGHGAFDTILTYLDYTLLDQSAAPLIAYAASREVGVINGSPLSFGLLIGEDPRTNPRLSGEFRPRIGQAAALYDFAQARNLPLLALAIQYPMRNPLINMTLTGPASPDELLSTLNAATLAIPEPIWQELNAELGVRLPPEIAGARA